jgi:hypothetical protein
VSTVDPLQSLGVAAALADHFETLARAGQDTIGEAEQIYPEIWRHLDDVRSVLATRGCDVSAYDPLRRAERLLKGVVDFQSVYDGELGKFRHRGIRYNVAGLARARQAHGILVALARA